MVYNEIMEFLESMFGFLLVGLVFLLIYMLIVLVFIVLHVIAMWRIFSKAGEKGWKAIIPFYNLYVMYKIAWKKKFFWIFVGLTFGGGLLSGVISGLTGNFVLSNSLMILQLISVIILSIIFFHKLSKSFGKDAGFTVGLIFLNTIFSLILAFGSAGYIGPGGATIDKPETGATM
jgi:hypothetical protein